MDSIFKVGREFLYPTKTIFYEWGKKKEICSGTKWSLLKELTNYVCISGKKKMILEECLRRKKKWLENKLVNMFVNIHTYQLYKIIICIIWGNKSKIPH